MSFVQSELDKLKKNNKQWEAYQHDDHCVVLAGPGSGKTATLSLKIFRLLNDRIKQPRGLACITYNNEAAREFKSRLKKLGVTPGSNVFLGTVHGFCLSCVISPFERLFRQNIVYPIKVASDETQTNYIQKIIDELKLNEHPYDFKRRISVYRRTILDRKSAEWHSEPTYAEVIEKYESYLHKAGYIDFDDQILIALELIENEPFVRKCLSARFPWLVIDEYQDLGYPLHKIVNCLIDNTNIKIFAVGDPDQSIYGFNGADPKYLIELANERNLKTLSLNINYRSAQRIIDGAEMILSPKPASRYKSNRSEEDEGEIYFYRCENGLEEQVESIVQKILPDLEQAGFKQKDIAILYIDSSDAKIISSVLDSRGIRYSGVKDGRYERTPLIRWLEYVAQWCCEDEYKNGSLLKEIYDIWNDLLLKTEQSTTDSNYLTNICLFYAAIRELRISNMILSDWLFNLNKKLSLTKKLSKLKDRPDELQALCDLYKKCQKGRILHNFTVSDFAGCGVNTTNLTLSTLHSSKGLEFDVVIIPGLEEGRLPHYKSTTSHAISENRRLFYVGVTRARYLVYLLYSGWYKNQYDGIFENGPSRFVKELKERLAKKNIITRP